MQRQVNNIVLQSEPEENHMNLVSSEGQVLTSRGMEDFQYPTLIDAVH